MENQNDNSVPSGEVRGMKNDIAESMPRIEVPSGSGDLVPPLPSIDAGDFSEINIPSDGSGGGSSKKLLIGAIAVVVLLILAGGGYYVWQSISPSAGVVLETGTPEASAVIEIPSPSEEAIVVPTETPEELPRLSGTETPLPVATETPAQKTPVLSGVSSLSLEIQSDAIADYTKAVAAIKTLEVATLAKSSFAELLVTTGGADAFPSLVDFSNAFQLSLPQVLLSRTAAWSLTVYRSGSSEETFCALVDNVDCAGLRLGLVLKVDSASGAKADMKSFETMAQSSLRSLIIPSVGASSYTGFKDATYNNIALRYFNFPIAPETKASSIASLDYAVLSAHGSTYIAIGTSRLSLYRMIDNIVK